MAVARNPDEPVVNYGRPTPEVGTRATALIPQTAVPGGFELPPNALSPDTIAALQGTDLQGAVRAAVAPLQDLPYFKADAEAQRAQAAYESRLAAYQAANPNASFFEARWNSLTPQEQSELRTSYGPARKNLDKSLEYAGVAPTQGQDLVDYMLANQGNMPEIAPKKGPEFGLETLAKIALLGGGMMLGGPLIQSLLSGVGAAGAAGTAGALGSGGATLGATIPSTVAGLVPTTTALGAGSTAAQLGAALAGGTTLGAAIPSTVAGLVPTTTALGPGSAAAQLGAALAGTAAGGVAPAVGANMIDELVITAANKAGISPALVGGGVGGLAALGGATTAPGSTGFGTPENYTMEETILTPTTPSSPLPAVVAGGATAAQAGANAGQGADRGPPENYQVDELVIEPSQGGTLQPFTPVNPLSPTNVTGVSPQINPFQPGLTQMPSVTPQMPNTPSGPTTRTPTSPTGPSTPTNPTGPVTPPGRDRDIPTLRRPNVSVGSQPFNLNSFLRSMTSPRAGQANLGNVSPFSGGGVGPGPGPLNLKGSSAPDIYPWVQESGG